MTDKKQMPNKQKPAHTIRCGEVTASIYERQSNSGFTYFDYSLGRRWLCASSRREAHGTSFFLKNERDLIEAVRAVSAWLRERDQQVTPGQVSAENSQAQS
jgi:hypothetical protein